MSWLLLCWLACSTPSEPQVAGPAAQVSVAVVSPPGKAEAVLEVRAAWPAGQSGELDELDVPGLTLEPVGEVSLETAGAQQVLTRRYKVTGKKGDYQVPPLELQVEGGAEPVVARSAPVWLDLGVKPPERKEMVDIAEPPLLWRLGWAPLGLLCLFASVGLLFLAGVRWAFSGPSKQAARVVAAPPPDIVVLRRWAAVRADQTLSEEEKAKALSQLFRWYVQAAVGLPAQSSTTSETVRALEAMAHLPEGNVPRAKRLLRATDLVKFAEVRPGEDFFADLDSDLRAFVDSTRPRRWEGQ